MPNNRIINDGDSGSMKSHLTKELNDKVQGWTCSLRRFLHSANEAAS